MNATLTREGKIEVAYHSTREGWGVLIIRDNPQAAFQIARVRPDGVYLTRDWASTEAGARKMANRLWSLDMGKPMKEDIMIACGPLLFE